MVLQYAVHVDGFGDDVIATFITRRGYCFKSFLNSRMSFWDASFTSSSSGTSTPPPQVSGQPSQSLNEEVTEVIGQLGRFWGGFRIQVRSFVFS